MKPARGRGYPKHLGSLCCYCQSDDDPWAQLERDQLISWSMTIGGRNQKGGYDVTGEFHGTSAAEAHDALARALPGKGTLWLFMCPAVHHLTMIEFWELLEAGAWTLTVKRPCRFDSVAGTDGSAAPKAPVLSDPPTMIEVCQPGRKGRIKIVDARNWSSFKPGRNLTAGRGARSLWGYAKSLVSVVESADLGGLAATIGAQAMHAYRSRYLDKSILVHANADALRLERDSLYPARNECYFLGKVRGPVWMLDANALYSHVARGDKAPARLAGYHYGNRVSVERLIGEGYSVLARVKVATDRPLYPCRKGERVFYPTGRFETILWDESLLFALQRCHVKGVAELSWYEPADLFTEFVSDFYAARQLSAGLGDKEASRLFKLLPSSLFGKFAQRAYRWIDHSEGLATEPTECWYQQHPYEGKMTKWRTIAWAQQFEDHLGEHPESVPSITSWVCDRARRWIASIMSIAGLENVIYCDTDAVMVIGLGKELLENKRRIGKQIGQLKIAGGPWSEVTIHGQKHYTAQNDHVHAGIPENAQEECGGVFRWQSPQKFQWVAGVDPTPSGRMVNHSYAVRQSYQLGTVMPDRSVTPFYLEDF